MAAARGGASESGPRKHHQFVLAEHFLAIFQHTTASISISRCSDCHVLVPHANWYRSHVHMCPAAQLTVDVGPNDPEGATETTGSGMVVPTKKITFLYRWRTDSGISIGLAAVKILADGLRNHGIGDVWVDRENLAVGCDMKEEIRKQIAISDFCIIVMFPGCLDRSANPKDFFCFELETCIGLGIQMILVLVDWEDIDVANAIPDDLMDTEFGQDLQTILDSTLLHFIDTEKWDLTKIVAALQ